MSGIGAIKITLASPDQIRSWSHGEVTKAATLDRDTLKPEVGGIFCERIFGPVRDFRCSCGKYTERADKGVICDRCGVEVTHHRVRRERMGHIELACPVSHTLFVETTPSPLALLLGISRAELKRVAYLRALVVTRVHEEAREHALKRLREEERQRTAKAW